MGLKLRRHDGGVGLANVQNRLAALYGDDHRFRLDRADGGGCVVSIALPFRTEPMVRTASATSEGAPARPSTTPL